VGSGVIRRASAHPRAPFLARSALWWYRRLRLVSIGGITDLTVVPGGEAEDPAFAFDVGPANALLDAAVEYLTGGSESYDKDGRRAARGEIHEGLFCSLLEEPHYRLGPPKSTGKELFNLPYLLERLSGTSEPTTWQRPLRR
jgi:anhydro-N-acetylmuramic acid kinase